MTQAAPADNNPSPQGDAGTKRLLQVLLGILFIAAVALVVLLVALLWPDDGGDATGTGEGYPIIPVRSIFGYGLTEPETLSKPVGAAFDPQGNIWVTDNGHSRVLGFTQDGDLIRPIGEEEGPGKLFGPNGIDFDDEGNIYVADLAAQKVQKYTTDGTWVQSFPSAEQDPNAFKGGFAPIDVAIADDKVVAGSQNGLYFFDQDGRLVGRFGKSKAGSGEDQFSFVNALTYDPATKHFYVADTLNRRVITLDSEGNRLWTSGSPDIAGSTTGFWQLVRGAAVGPGCDLYVVDTFRTTESGVGDGYIAKIRPDGTLVSLFGKYGEDEGAFSFPEKLDYYAGNDLWAIADREHNRVLLYRLTEEVPPPSQPQAELYPQSFLAQGDVGAVPEEGCPEPGARPGAFPWWIIIVLLVLLITWLAVRRIRKDRRERLAREAAAADLGASGTEPAAVTGLQDAQPEAGDLPEAGPPEGS